MHKIHGCPVDFPETMPFYHGNGMTPGSPAMDLPRIGSAVSKISGTLVELRAMNESRSRQRREIRVYLSNQDRHWTGGLGALGALVPWCPSEGLTLGVFMGKSRLMWGGAEA